MTVQITKVLPILLSVFSLSDIDLKARRELISCITEDRGPE